MSEMRTGIVLTSVLAAVCFAAQPPAPAPDSMGVVAGTVVDALSGEPLQGDVVVENTAFGSGIDSAGRFSILLAPGKYRLGTWAMFHAEASESAAVSAACTTRVDFRLLPQKYVDDSIMASLAGLKIRELARNPKDPTANNSVRAAAWRTYLSGRGTYCMKRTSFGVEGQHTFEYLVMENGRARIVSDGREWSYVSEYRYSDVQLLEDRRWNPDSSRYYNVPFSGTMPKDRELRFALSNDAEARDPVLY